MKHDNLVFFAGALAGMAGAELSGMWNPQPASWAGYVFWTASSLIVWTLADLRSAR